MINIRIECFASYLCVSQQCYTPSCCIGALQCGERHSAVAGGNSWQWSNQAPHSSFCKFRQACSRSSPFIPTSAIRYCTRKAGSPFLLSTQICLLDSLCRRQITAKWNLGFHVSCMHMLQADLLIDMMNACMQYRRFEDVTRSSSYQLALWNATCSSWSI